MIPLRPHHRALALAGLLAAGGACVDGPFAHANPYDIDTPLALSIQGGRDTLSIVDAAVLFQLVTNPTTAGTTVAWGSSDSSLLQSNGLGRFTVLYRPLQPTTVTVTARLGGHEAERRVVVLPAP